MPGIHDHPDTAEGWLAALSDAIRDEAEALASANADALMEAVERKAAAAEALGTMDQDILSRLDLVSVAELREANLSNAALMQVSQAQVIWALGQLGRVESQPTYARNGYSALTTRGQYFGAA